MIKPRFLTISILLILLAGCAQPAESCPSFSSVDLSGVGFTGDDDLPFQFPLDDYRIYTSSAPFSTDFAAYGMTTRGPEYHAAEDIHQPAGTPVFAMADGRVSFSGPMEGYGWLIIIDHPQANLYSLYGHLSPSRWQIEPGRVEEGELIGYLGDNDENGGSAENPLRPHLHFGVRTGQRADYSGMGSWRWQAGWIKPCPQDLGWLQPSVIITNQEIPAGGFPEPTAGLITKWWIELLLTGIYLFGGACMFVYAAKGSKPLVLVVSGAVLLAAGWILYGKGAKMSYVLFIMAVLFAAVGIYRVIRLSIKRPRASS
jgi:murein DD-endopeptidase MepM/ murein hydrolase activator NlpD